MKRRNLLKFLAGLSVIPVIGFTKDKQHPPVVVPPRIIKQPAPPRRTPDRPLSRIIADIRHGVNNYALQFNDEITRNDARFNVNKYLNEVGVYRWAVVCDETNNPPSAIDQNLLIVDIEVQCEENDIPFIFRAICGSHNA
jgi:hypothetical protein